MKNRYKYSEMRGNSFGHYKNGVLNLSKRDIS
jgi:hypothetical protein